MILTLYTETVIDSCHYLRNYNGPCKNLHGHSWKISIWIKGEDYLKDENGILFDFRNVQKLKEKYDHKFLNEIEPFDKFNPTAENISETIYNELKEYKSTLQFKIRVYETAVGKKTYCECGDF